MLHCCLTIVLCCSLNWFCVLRCAMPCCCGVCRAVRCALCCAVCHAAAVLCCAESFRQHFERFGKVVEAQIMVDHTSGRSRGFG